MKSANVRVHTMEGLILATAVPTKCFVNLFPISGLSSVIKELICDSHPRTTTTACVALHGTFSGDVLDLRMGGGISGGSRSGMTGVGV